MAYWIGATTAFGSVVWKANRSFVVAPCFTFRADVQRVETAAKNASVMTSRGDTEGKDATEGCGRVFLRPGLGGASDL